jgi:hypothetical protein
VAEIQNRHPELDVGSYPFFREDRYGTTLVVRGIDIKAIDTAARAIMDAVRDGGETPEDLGEEI